MRTRRSRATKYFDLQFVVSGEERFGYAPRDLCKPAMAYDADLDLVFYEEPAESGCIILKAGDFAIVPPEDAHAPRRQTAAGACAVKKNRGKGQSVKGKNNAAVVALRNCSGVFCGLREAAMYGNANNNRLFLFIPNMQALLLCTNGQQCLCRPFQDSRTTAALNRDSV